MAGIDDILYAAGESVMGEFPVGLLNSPVDILFSQRLQTDFVVEFPIGLLNSPLDELWEAAEILELPAGPPPPLNAPLDITMGNDNDDLLFVNLVLRRERSSPFVG